jgi:hypothetical protein
MRKRAAFTLRTHSMVPRLGSTGDRLGVIYTANEIVRFIVESAE